MIGAIRDARSRDIRISAALSLQERVNRAYVHREAQVANLILVDRGDRGHLLPKEGLTPARIIPIDYSGDISEIQKRLEESKKAIQALHSAQPPPRRSFPHPPAHR